MLFNPVETLSPLSSGGPISIIDNLVASSLDERILVSDINSGKILHDFEGDGETVSCIAISPDKEWLVVTSQSLQVLVYSLETDVLVKTFAKAHESAIMSITIDESSTLAATGGAEGAVKVWDLRNHRLTHNLRGHGSIVSALAFYGELGSTNWKLASGSDDGKVIVWDLVKSKQMAVLENHTSSVSSLYWTSRGDALLSAGRDKIVSIWPQLKLGATIPVMEEVETVGTIMGKYIFTGSRRSVRIWSLTAETISHHELTSDESEITRVIIKSPNILYGILSDQTIIVLEVSDDGTITPKENLLSLNHGEIIDLLVTSNNQNAVLATNSTDVRVANLNGNLLEFRPLVGHTDIVIAIDILGRWVLSGGKDKEARLWDLETGECKVVFTGHTGAIGAVSLSRGDPTVPQFVLTGSQDLTIKKWGADGNAEYTRKAHDKDINTLDVSSNNKYFATGSQDRSIKIWSTENGETLNILRGHKRGVWSVKFTNQNTLISGSGDKTVRLWNLNDFTPLRTFEGHMNSVLKVVFLDAHRVASAGGDGLIKIWDTATSEASATLDGHEDKVWSLTKTDKGQLVSGGGDGVLQVWQDCTEEEQIRVDQESEELIEKQQELENSVRASNWDRAIKLALELNKPLRLLKLFNDIFEAQEPNSISGIVIVDELLRELDGKQLRTLLERVRDWNTNGRTSVVAQRVLQTILTGPKAQEKLNHGPYLALIQALIPYTQRHLNRTHDMLETSYVLDYTIKQMLL